jgi:ADP-heptose:LPS heptosyltransferase
MERWVVKKILIYRLGSLGDTIMVLPCFRRIREVYPDAHITVLTNKPVASKAAPLDAVIGGIGLYDDLIEYPVHTRNPSALYRIQRKVKKGQFDLVINLNAPRTALVSRRDRLFFTSAGIRNLIGFTDGEDFEPVKDLSTGLYEPEALRIARRLAPIGIPDISGDEYWDLKFTDQEEKQTTSVLSPLSGSAFITIGLGTKQETNHWGTDRWKMLVAALCQRYPAIWIVAIGAPDEYDEVARLQPVAGNRFLNLCGKASPRVAASVIKRARLYIGHDSGPIHMAGAVGTPLVGIYSARNVPGLWYPRGKDNRILWHQVPCTGCQRTVCYDQQRRCIRSIMVEEVIDAVAGFMQMGQQMHQETPLEFSDKVHTGQIVF